MSSLVEADIWAYDGKVISEALREFRETQGYSQLDLADELGWSQSYISKLERGHRTLRNVDDLHRLRAIGILGEVSDEIAPAGAPPEIGASAVDVILVAAHDLAYRAGRPTEALNLIRLLGHQSPSLADVEDGDTLKAALFEAHVLSMVASGNSLAKAHKILLQLATNPTVQSNTGLEGLVGMDLGIELRRAGNYNDGLPLLEGAVSKLVDRKDFFHAGEAHAYLAYGLAETGEFSRALDHVEIAKETIQEESHHDDVEIPANVFDSARLLVARQQHDRDVFAEATASYRMSPNVPVNWRAFYYSQLIAGAVECDLPLDEDAVAHMVDEVVATSLFRPIRLIYFSIQKRSTQLGHLAPPLLKAMSRASEIY